MDQAGVGQRVREAISRTFNGRSHRSVAEAVGMTPDAFSRAVNGSRAFSSLELARVADLLAEDVHWLITGTPDPQRVIFAARHDFDQEMGRHVIPGREDDDAVLQTVTLAYRQARQWLGRDDITLPDTAAEVREALGSGFVTSFAERLEECFGVDVIRVQGLTTDYSFTVAGRRAILLKSEPNWFRSNWSLAHELAHLVLGHHDVSMTTSASAREQQANAFAGELLLPTAELRAVNWQEIDAARLAGKVWAYGVSTQALKTRLQVLGLPVSSDASALLSNSTQRLLRAHPAAMTVFPSSGPFVQMVAGSMDLMTTRMSQSAERRFPRSLIRAHLDGIASGRLSKATLAWMLEVAPADLDVEEPELQPDVPVDDFIAAMGLGEA
jgi:Zn-dependent peptidase ImmA (M78 family)